MVLLPGPAAAAARLPRVPRSACRVYADVVATGANHDGWKSMQGAPSAKAQVSLIKNALARAGVDPAEVSLIEAHGTGTKLGDPVEFRGLTEAFRSARPVPPAVRSDR
jgi:acyl transferase domain-containing protein